MIRDFNLVKNIDQTYDTCIVGSGPAGITLALKLADKGINVALLEAGGLDYSAESQNYYECESVGHDAWPEYTRLRYFGGTSNHWSGRCRPFEASDFDKRVINGLPGWPIRYDSIKGYLEEAMTILDLSVSEGFNPINKPLLTSNFYPDEFAKSPPTRFKKKYLNVISEHKNIDCLYNANVVDLTLDSAHQTVKSITIMNSEGYHTDITAKDVVVCLGGIENPRFLLNCDKQIVGGIGNKNGMVGRCFMEHLNVPIGSFLHKDPDDASPMQFFTSDNFCSDRGIGKSNLTMSMVHKIKSYGRTHAIKTFFKNIACNLEIEEKVQFISDFSCPGMGTIGSLVEQAPNLDSRVSLSNAKDNMGLRRAKFDWQIAKYDERTIRSTSVEMAKQFAQANLGNIKLADFILDESLPIKFGHHAHHMGTTRMSEDPKDGVVNTDCKVHDVDNLYIAGSSVFSTGGACNPTMPIVQLSLRLADHLTQ